jgi:cell division initiation protein
MNYTPNDLQNVVFKKSVIRGYHEDSVHEVIDKVVEDYNFLMRENIELKDKVAMLNEGIRHYKNIEESIQNTLVMAQSTSEEIKKNSFEKTQNMIKEAQLRTQKMLEDAQGQSEKMIEEAQVRAQKALEEANREVSKIHREYEEARRKLQLYKTKSESLLMSQLEMLKLVMEESS